MSEELSPSEKAERFFSGLSQLLYDNDVLHLHSDAGGIEINIFGDKEMCKFWVRDLPKVSD